MSLYFPSSFTFFLKGLPNFTYLDIISNMAHNRINIISKKIRWLSIIFLLLLGTTWLFAQEEGPDWYIMRDSVRRDWRMVYNRADPNRFRLIQISLPSNEAPQRVLFIFPKPSSAYDTAVERITAAFHNRGVNTDFTAINFEGDSQLGEELLREIAFENYDLIYSVGSTSTKFIYDNLSRITTPIVTVTSKDPVLLGLINTYGGSGQNIAFTSLDVPIQVQMAYLRELRPDLRNIAVMYAKNNTSAYGTQVIPLIEFAGPEGINVIEVVVEDQSNARAELRQMMDPALDAMRRTDPRLDNSVFWITGSTSVFQEITTINSLAREVPVLSVVTDVVREGEDSAAISIGASFESNADLASFYGLDILLNGVNPGSLPVGVISPPDIAINFLKTRTIDLKVPFSFFESASTIYNANGDLVRLNGSKIGQ